MILPACHPRPVPFPLSPSFPRDSLRVFQKLSEIFSDENNYSLSRELLIKVRGGGVGWGGGLTFPLEVSVKTPPGVCLAHGPLWGALWGREALVQGGRSPGLLQSSGG